jgi:hypothetical protein
MKDNELLMINGLMTVLLSAGNLLVVRIRGLKQERSWRVKLQPYYNIFGNPE